MIEWPLLSVTIFLPLFGALIIFLIKDDDLSSNNIKWSALWTSIGTFILSCVIWLQFDSSIADYQLTEKYRWFSTYT